MDIVVGAPYNSGALFGGDHYNYVPIPDEIKERVSQLNEIGQKYDRPLKAAALQFSTAHPAVRAVIPRSTRPERSKRRYGNNPARHSKRLLE